MLILTRKAGESVIIGNDVTVTVLRVKGNQVRIGIAAPPSVSMDREEVYERKRREKLPSTGDGREAGGEGSNSSPPSDTA